MGGENRGETLTPDVAVDRLTLKLKQLRAVTGDRPIFIDQFRVEDYTPGFELNGRIPRERVGEFLAAARQKPCYPEAERLAQEFELDLTKTIRRFSTGMRQKLGLIQALMHRPKLLILDEPTSALDPLIRHKVFEELRQVGAEGRTVLFSSHSLEEVQSLCDEVVILREGRIVEHEEIEVLKKRALRRIQVVFPAKIRSDQVTVPPELQRVAWKENVLCGTWSGQIHPLLEWFQSHQVVDVIIEPPDLNDLFISYYALSPTESPTQNV